MLSSMVTLKLADPLFPAASIAVHVTSVTPIGNKSSDAAVHVGVISPSMSSTDDTENDTDVPPSER